MPNERPPGVLAPHNAIDAGSRAIHLALVALGIAALVSGQFAGDYKSGTHPGFTVHRWIGIAMAAAVAARVLWGIVGPRVMRFSRWLPVTGARLAAVAQDLAALVRLQLPARAVHEGIAGFVQAIGLAAFAWMAVTGACLFVWLEPGTRATGVVRVLKELHEGGQAVVYGFIALHVGAVVVHALAGDNIWRHMFFMSRRSGPSQ